MALATMALALLGTTAGTASAADATTIAIGATSPSSINEGAVTTFRATWHWPVGTEAQTKLSAELTAISPASWPSGLTVTAEDPCESSITNGQRSISHTVDPDGSRTVSCDIVLTTANNAGPDADQSVSLRVVPNEPDDLEMSGLDTIGFTIRDTNPVFTFGNLPTVVEEGVPFTLPLLRSGGRSLTPEIFYNVKYTGYGAEDLSQSASDGPLSIPNPPDNTYDPDGRHVVVTITGPGPRATAEIPVRDDDSIVRIATTEVAARRADGFATIQLSRQGDLGSGVDVNYKIVGGTAQPGRDYEASATGSKHFQADQASAEIQVPLLPNGAPDARRFTVELSSDPWRNLTGRGTTSPSEPSVATVTIAATPEKPKEPKPKDPREEPKDPPKAAPPELTAQIKLRTKGGAEYVALPKAKTKVFVGVELKTDKAIAAGTKLRLVGTGLTFDGVKNAQTTVTVASLIPAGGKFYKVGKALAAHTTSKKNVTVTPFAVDDAVKVAGDDLFLKAPTSALNVDGPLPTVVPKRRMTEFRGSYSAPTCEKSLTVQYNEKGVLPATAKTRLRSEPGAGVCTFHGTIKWSPAIFDVKRLFVRVWLGERRSKTLTLVIKHNR